MKKRRAEINHKEIEELGRQLFDAASRRALRLISNRAKATREAMDAGLSKTIDTQTIRREILVVDNAIGGATIDRLLVPTDHGYTCDLPMGDRPIYRPLQYALSEIISGSLPRYSILMSGLHLEGVLKKKYRGILPRLEHAPLGKIVDQVKSRSLLEINLISQLQMVARVVNTAKHDFSEEAVRLKAPGRGVESQVFTVVEAVWMYFICRKIGFRLMQV